MTHQSGTAEQNGKLNHGEESDVRRLVERAVTQAFEAKISQMQAHVVEQVLAALPARESSSDASAVGVTHSAQQWSSHLVQAVSNIHAGSSQKEILRALLDAGSGHCSRIGLFVVKAGTASGWQSRGFGDGDDPVKDFALDLNVGPSAHTFQYRVATPGNVAEMGAAFVQRFGTPADEQILVLPLTLKDKVAALVYADGGDSAKLDSAALELIVIATSAWLEVISLRKHATPKDDVDGSVPATSVPAEHAAPPVQTVSSFSDPFASHTPRHTPASITPELAAEVVEAVHARGAAAGAAPATATDPLAGLSAEDADVHRKAQRFARLLVDEIKLYNQAKVAEGRRNKDLYDRLKEDIDKSRGSFQKRYGSTAAASVDYFQQELMRSLAEDDISIMGPNFH
jgi:hypothetical protein